MISSLIRSKKRLAGVVLAVFAGISPVLAGEIAVVTNRVVYPGEIIEDGMLEEVPLVRGNRNLGPIVQDTELVRGKIARRTLLPGRLIASNSVREAFLVQTGAPVEVVVIDGNLVITITAVPLEPGAAGDVVKLRNIDSGRVFSGVVMADGTVRVGAS